MDMSRSRRLGLHRCEHKRFAQFTLSSLTESQSHNYNGVCAFFAGPLFFQCSVCPFAGLSWSVSSRCPLSLVHSPAERRGVWRRFPFTPPSVQPPFRLVRRPSASQAVVHSGTEYVRHCVCVSRTYLMTSSTQVPHSLSFEPRGQGCADTPSVGPSPQPLTGHALLGEGAGAALWRLGVGGDAPAAHSVKNSFLQVPAGLLVLGGSFQGGGSSHHLTSPESGPVSPSQVGGVGRLRVFACDVCTAQGCPRAGQRPVQRGSDGLLLTSLFRLGVTCLFFYNLGGHVCPFGGLSQCTVFPSEFAPPVPGPSAELSMGQELQG